MMVELPAPQVISTLRAKGWRIIDIARRLEVSAQSVTQWERGKANPKRAARLALAALMTEKPPNREEEAAMVAEVVKALFTVGWPTTVIAQRTGCTPRMVQMWKHGRILPGAGVNLILRKMLTENPPIKSREILLRLMSQYAEGGVYAMGYPKLAKLMGMDANYVLRMSWELAEQGFITRVDSEAGAPARWRIVADPLKLTHRQLKAVNKRLDNDGQEG